MDEIELVNVRIITATDSGSDAGQGTSASKNEATNGNSNIKERLNVEQIELNQNRIEESGSRKRRSFTPGSQQVRKF